MSVSTYLATMQGIERLPVEASTLDEATLRTGHGVYSVMRIYPGHRVLRFDRHLARLRRSGQGLGMRIEVTDAWLRDSLRQAVLASGFEQARARITVPFDTPDQAILSLEEFTPPHDNLYTQGVRVGLAEAARVEPAIKNTRFIEQRQTILQQAGSDWYEILMHTPAGRILEGTGSNFYGVLNGTLRTAGEGVLEGIARGLLLDVAPAIIPVVMQAVTVGDLPHLSEAMLTSASRSVIPIVQIGEVVIGQGQPGDIARRLRQAYEQKVEQELETL
jgi:branched-chain amino acid aminotransferase